jgi:hypothetical protein
MQRTHPRVMVYLECELFKLTRVNLHFLTNFFVFNLGLLLLVASFEILIFL